MEHQAINDSNALTTYVNALNEIATKLDVRHYSFVPPKGTVLTVACDTDLKVRLTLANGKGGSILHQMPTGVMFKCTHAHAKKKVAKTSIWTDIKNLWFR